MTSCTISVEFIPLMAPRIIYVSFVKVQGNFHEVQNVERVLPGTEKGSLASIDGRTGAKYTPFKRFE